MFITFLGTKEEFNKFLNKLHRKIDVDIQGKLTEQFKIHEDILGILNKVRKIDYCFGFNLDLKGSTIENVKIGYPDEFDFGLVNPRWTGKIVLLETDQTPAGFGYALQDQQTCLNNYLVKNTNHVDPTKVRGRLRELVERAMRELGMEGRIQDVREGGPAVTFEEITPSDRRFPLISIDLAIAIDLREWPKDARKFPPAIMNANAQLVPKVLNEPHTDVWQISFSRVEKKIMENIDRDGGCRRKVLQLAKHLKSRSAGHGFGLASYHLKMTLFYLNKEMNQEEDWAQDKLADRFMDLINRLLHYLSAKKLPSYFIEGYNILKDKSYVRAASRSIKGVITRLYELPDSLIPENDNPQPRHKTHHKKSKKPFYILNI